MNKAGYNRMDSELRFAILIDADNISDKYIKTNI